MEEKTAPSQPTVPASTPPAATLSAKKQKSKIMLFSLIGVGVVILLGIIFFVFKNTHSATQAPNKTQTVDITNIPLHEAPQLAEKVKAGTLPPVRDRLPKTPMLINPVERVGEYGGTWRMAGLKTNDHSIMYRSMGYENLVRWNDTWTGVIPNVAQAYDVNSDGAE